MTLEREEPGVWFATCDECGDRLLCETDGNAERADAQDEIEELGWQTQKPETVKYYDGPGLSRKNRVTYETHLCPDCS